VKDWKPDELSELLTADAVEAVTEGRKVRGLPQGLGTQTPMVRVVASDELDIVVSISTITLEQD